VADEARPAELREVSAERPVFDKARELIGDVAEVVRARWLHEMAPDLWPLLVVDENGLAKACPQPRAGGLYGGEIAGDALVLQERRSACNVRPRSTASDQPAGGTEAEARLRR
jgi:hypothetical protein